MTTVILGGNGYIGSILRNSLKCDSVDLCLFGKDLGYSVKKNIINFDLSSYDNIILLSGHSSVGMCEYNRKNAWANNVDYFYKICEELQPEQKLIYASSASVYGQKPYICSESDINLNPINHSDLTKITIDVIANKFIADNKNIIGFRFGTVNGFSYNVRSDLMINSMFISAKNNNKITVCNININRPILGTYDLVRCFETVLNSKKFYSGQYNLSSFISTVNEISQSVSKELKVPIEKIDDFPNAYNFSISTEKFESMYNFRFEQDINSVIYSMNDINFDSIDIRNNDRLFDCNI
jgi:nucleoside-diphosphate-sugar epimerase